MWGAGRAAGGRLKQTKQKGRRGEIGVRQSVATVPSHAKTAGIDVNPLRTHWTRFLYHDYLSRGDADSAHVHEVLMKRSESLLVERIVIRSPLRMAVLLLAIYVAMYLAVGGALYLMHAPDADARIAPYTDTVVASDAAS